MPLCPTCGKEVYFGKYKRVTLTQEISRPVRIESSSFDTFEDLRCGSVCSYFGILFRSYALFSSGINLFLSTAVHSHVLFKRKPGFPFQPCTFSRRVDHLKDSTVLISKTDLTLQKYFSSFSTNQIYANYDL